MQSRPFFYPCADIPLPIELLHLGHKSSGQSASASVSGRAQKHDFGGECFPGMQAEILPKLPATKKIPKFRVQRY